MCIPQNKSNMHNPKLKVLILLIQMTACDSPKQPDYAAIQQTQWNGSCHDKAMLLATTTGSPDYFECSNRLHRMHVQVATSSSKEEAAALVFCECDHDAGAQ